MAINNKSKKMKAKNTKSNLREKSYEQMRKLETQKECYDLLNKLYLEHNIFFAYDIDFLVSSKVGYDDYIKYLIEVNQNKLSEDKILKLKNLYNRFIKTQYFYSEETKEKYLYFDNEGNEI